ncbi:DUF2892 domain-containing protein [Lacibacter luteus]|uniref:DUF2892 domain-containing protein n=1 Tax=Lacibacter luteus TaxID=2508719 RepID=A0A4V1M7Q8_9BACT|nr:DUF2892 domain-containing protein [Lacibacter luteus]RXK60925.1 DUF2892 domain-containing protein [Lacibacter luteus]
MRSYFKQWTGMRLLRLLMGVVAIVQGIASPTPLLWVIGAVLLVQAFLNIGCMDSSCNIPVQQQKMHR